MLCLSALIIQGKVGMKYLSHTNAMASQGSSAKSQLEFLHDAARWKHSGRSSQLLCVVPWVLETSWGGLRVVASELLEQEEGGSPAWSLLRVPAPGAELWSCGCDASSWLSGNRAVPKPNKTDLGASTILKILGPEYKLWQASLIIDTVLSWFSPVLINSPADQDRQGQFREHGLEAEWT